MKFLLILSLLATQALCTPVDNDLAAIETECGALGVMEWDAKDLSEGGTLRKCKKHPFELGISSSLENTAETPENLDSSFGKEVNSESLESLAKRQQVGGPTCKLGTGRGSGWDYDYGCKKGWCWRNCNVGINLEFPYAGKPWCWLAYEGGKGGWTPCGRWQDCEWSYNNKNAKCGKGNCKACGCGC